MGHGNHYRNQQPAAAGDVPGASNASLRKGRIGSEALCRVLAWGVKLIREAWTPWCGT